MPYAFEHNRSVEFAETDMAGIVHFSNFFRYMEAAEHAFIRSLGETLHRHEDGRMTGWARVHAECDYRAPLRYPEPFRVQVLVREKRSSSLSYLFRFLRGDSDEEFARGSLTCVCVAREPGEERMRAVPMPASIADQVDVAPEHLLQPKNNDAR